MHTGFNHNLIYFKDIAGAAEAGLYVNLYMPSELMWQATGASVTLVQETRYPDSETATVRLQTTSPVRFPLRFRVPGWARTMSIAVNGEATGVPCRPGTWATVARTWRTGDRVDVRIPLALRMESVDRQHPDRVAVVRGPVVLVLEGAYHDPFFHLPERDDDLEGWLVPEPWRPATAFHGVVDEDRISTKPTVFRVVPPDKSPVRLKFRPFYDIGEGYPYFMYFDRKALPWRLW